MVRKDRIDAFGAVSLVGFSLLLGFNQVVIKVVNEGMQPVFWAGLRSLGGAVCVALWMLARGRALRPAPGTLGPGLLIGAVFAAEFLLLFIALDLTTVARSSVIFYSMPVWLSLAAHFLLPGERITRWKAAGLALAVAGVAWALLDRGASGGGGAASLAGDLCALGAAVCWAGIALCARATRLMTERPEMQLLWQVGVSAPLLLAAAPFFGPFLRDPGPVHLAGLAFQVVVIETRALRPGRSDNNPLRSASARCTKSRGSSTACCMNCRRTCHCVSEPSPTKTTASAPWLKTCSMFGESKSSTAIQPSTGSPSISASVPPPR